jgi:hypothetical protein
MLAIRSDVHSSVEMGQIPYGVFQSRQGGMEARSVVNTGAWPKLQRWLNTRRLRRSDFANRRTVSAHLPVYSQSLWQRTTALRFHQPGTEQSSGLRVHGS